MHTSRRFLQISASLCLAVLFAANPQSLRAQSGASLAERIQKVMDRPEFARANFGIEFYDIATGKVVYSLNANKLFVPASTTKTLTEGTILAKLGADYRFHTVIYRTGPVDKKGVLKGDLILVASGDPNLSNRAQADGTLAFVDEDHSYGGPALPGDPLAVIKELAKAVADKGIHKIEGRVLVDASLFPDGGKEGGTGVVVSSIVVNDNVIDLVATPGAKVGDPVSLAVSPKTAYVSFVNHLTTSAAGSSPTIQDPAVVTNADGTIAVTVNGTLPLGAPPLTAPYAVPSPTKFAETVLGESLTAAGIEIKAPKSAAAPDYKALARLYTADNQVAEHVSLPLGEEVKVTLKVSQNLHASMGPWLLGTLIAKDAADPLHAGFKVERAFLQDAKLDLSGISQGDGEGGDWADLFSPEFIAHYMAYWSTRPDFQVFFKALPILGKDGTLAKIQVNNPGAGHVFAKTGTFGSEDKLNGKMMLNGKGLAGFVITASGKRLAFAAYVNHVSLPPDPDAAQSVGGQALGEIAAAAYDAPLDAPAPAASTSVTPAAYDIIIRNGHIIDGTGNPWYAADVAIQGDRIAAIGNLSNATAKKEIDAKGQIVSPGFIDMLGQSESSLLLDNRSLSKLSQGITSEITGEGGSIAPQNEKTLAPLKPFLEQFHFTVDWTTLDGYFKRLEKQGTPLNIGTYVGSAQVREAIIGDDDRAPTPAELTEMESMVEQAMKDGAFGVSSALIYPPNIYAKTDELIALAKVASKYGGLYATHMRSEGTSEMQALDEAIRIGREANLPVEVFHLKVSGKARWGNMKKVVAKIQDARDSGLDIAASMYPYPAGGTALASALPPWAADGGVQKLLERLKEPAVRARIKKDLAGDHPNWENLYYDCGGGVGVLLASIEKPELKQFEGKDGGGRRQSLEQIPGRHADGFCDCRQRANRRAVLHGQRSGHSHRPRAAMDEHWARRQRNVAGRAYFRAAHASAGVWVDAALPGSLRARRTLDAAGIRHSQNHVVSGAARTSREGAEFLKPGFFADVTIFDAATIIDKATFVNPTQLSEGIDVHYR